MIDAITTRSATLQDLDTLLAFEQGVIAAERPFDPTLKPDPINYYNIPEMIAAPHIELLVAEYNGRLIGSGYARIENARHYLQHPRHAYLGFMYVLPEYRGKGVNQKVIAALHRWSHSQGMTELRLDVYSDNHRAIRAYEKAGFIQHMIAMRMPVNPADR
jgi:RimJ/RimL family protein N-acetyltransferase